MNEATRKAMEVWLASREKEVRVIAKRFPPGTRLNVHGQAMWVVAYAQGGGLMVSAVDPHQDYDLAIAVREPLCPHCAVRAESLIVK